MKLLGFIAVIGGADPSNPLERDNAARHVMVGFLIIAVATWAFGASLLTFHSSFHGTWVTSALFAALLAGIVFSIDVLITVSPLKDERARTRFKVLAIRAVLSLGVGLIISHATILYIYHDDISARVAATNNDQIKEITTKTIAASSHTPVIDQAKEQISKDRDQIGKEDTTFTNASKNLEQLKKSWEADQVCVNGNRAANGDICGDGPEATALRKAYEDFRDSKFPTIQTTHDDSVKTLNADIERQNQTLNDANAKRNAEVAAATDAARNNLGLQAQNDALLGVLTSNWTAWLWPAFFILLDIAVAFMKAVLPESAYDRRRRAQERHQKLIDNALMTPLPPAGTAEQLAAVLTKAADREAEVAIAVIDDRADRQLKAIRQRAERAKASPRTLGPRPWRGSRHIRIAVTAIVVAVAVVVTAVVTSGDDAPRAAGDSSQSLHLRDAMTLTVPAGAISDGAAVSADYVPSSPWQYHTAVSSPVEFSTPGRVIGAPHLSIAVPEKLQAAAASGAIQLAFRSNDPAGWTEYPVAYDARAHTVNADLKHFSTWQFWTWDWVSIGANINQTVGQIAGHRASEHAQCTSGIQPPKWFNFAAGITDEPAMIIRSCLQGHQGDDTLDVQIVNNRPYGMELSYSGAPIAYGWHQPAATTAESLRNLVGDLSVSGGQGLYLPPLSRASVGIKNIGDGKRQVFSIRPSGLTLTADALQILADKLLDAALGKTLGAVFAKNSNDVFKAAAGSKCTKARLAITSSMNAVDVTKFILGDGRECVEALLVVLGRSEVQKGSGMDMAKVGEFSTWITKLRGASAAGVWAEIFDKYATAVDYFTDKSVEIKELGFGFSILAHSSISDQPAPPPTSTPKPTTPAPTSTKTAPTKPAPTTKVQAPNPPPTRPAPVTTPTPTPPPVQEVRVNAYDNWGPVTTPGTAMCSGTPSRPESMPGGTVSQEFTVDDGITYLDTATVQIDRNASMTVHAALAVNGSNRATDNRTPADDTTFTFGRVPVHAGDKVTLTLTWSGTAGKLDTIYTTGNPPGSHLVITNTCSDYGSPHNLDTTSTGLRATVAGVKS